MSERIRTTISLDPEVLQVFADMAEAAGISVSRCMGDWLRDTSEGAQFVVQKLNDVRRSPVDVIAQFHEEQRSGRVADEALARPPRARTAAPSSNTGLKSQGKAVAVRKHT